MPADTRRGSLGQRRGASRQPRPGRGGRPASGGRSSTRRARCSCGTGTRAPAWTRSPRRPECPSRPSTRTSRTRRGCSPRSCWAPWTRPGSRSGSRSSSCGTPATCPLTCATWPGSTSARSCSPGSSSCAGWSSARPGGCPRWPRRTTSGPPSARSPRWPAAFGHLSGRGLLDAPDPLLAASHFAFLILGRPLDRSLFCGPESGFTPAELTALADAGTRVFLAAYAPA